MKLLKTYGFPLLLLLSIAGGVLLGSCRPDAARAIRPLGDLFLNLVFMIIVPLVFFTVSSAIASSTDSRRLSRVSWAMLFVFLATSIVAAVCSLPFMLLVQPTPGAGIVLKSLPVQEVPSLPAQMGKAFTAADFPELISRRSMLPLIVFSVGVGVATRSCKEAGASFGRFLSGGARVFLRLIDYVMYVAPVGLLAWFAATVVDTGEALAAAYFRVFVVYYVFSALYFAGEMLILSVFGFPSEILPLLAAISVIIDPLATLLNATGDNVAAMMVTRLTEGEVWRTVPEGAGP